MGKGDKKSKRGKIIMGSHGVSRPNKKRVPVVYRKADKAINAETTDKKTSKKAAAQTADKKSKKAVENIEVIQAPVAIVEEAPVVNTEEIVAETAEKKAAKKPAAKKPKKESAE